MSEQNNKAKECAVTNNIQRIVETSLSILPFSPPIFLYAQLHHIQFFPLLILLSVFHVICNSAFPSVLSHDTQARLRQETKTFYHLVRLSNPQYLSEF